MPGFLNSVVADARPRSAPDRYDQIEPGNWPTIAHSTDTIMISNTPESQQPSAMPTWSLKVNKMASQAEEQPVITKFSQPAVPPTDKKVKAQNKKKYHKPTTTGSEPLVGTIENETTATFPQISVLAIDTPGTKRNTKGIVEHNQQVQDASLSTSYSFAKGQDAESNKPLLHNKDNFLLDQPKMDKKPSIDAIRSAGQHPGIEKPEKIIADTTVAPSESVAVNPLPKREVSKLHQRNQTEAEQTTGQATEPFPGTTNVATTETNHQQEAVVESIVENMQPDIGNGEDKFGYEIPVEDNKSDPPVSDNSTGIHIGQIDITVQSEPKPPASHQSVQADHNGFTSRYYLRRL